MFYEYVFALPTFQEGNKNHQEIIKDITCKLLHYYQDCSTLVPKIKNLICFITVLPLVHTAL